MSSPKRKSVKIKTPPPPPPNAVLWMAERWKAFGWMFVAVGAIGTAIVVIPKATEIVEPMAPAHRAYVRDTHAPTRAIVDNMQIQSFERQLASAKTERGGWTIQLQREKDRTAKQLIEAQIERLDHDMANIEGQIKRLKGH